MTLAERLGPQPLAFDDLAEADTRVLAAVVRAADRDLLLTALVGAAPELVERVLADVSGGGGRSRPAANWTSRARSACATWKRPAGRSPGWPSVRCPAPVTNRRHNP